MEQVTLDSQPGDPDGSTNTILACAAESDRRQAVLAAAIDQAQRQHVRLVLYDVDAASSLVDPMPEFNAERYEHPLSPTELRDLGRGRLAEQVEQARARGVQAFGWLPCHHGADAMVDYAREVGAATVMLSAELETPSFMQQLHHLTATRAQAHAGTSVTVVLVPG